MASILNPNEGFKNHEEKGIGLMINAFIIRAAVL